MLIAAAGVAAGLAGLVVYLTQAPRHFNIVPVELRGHDQPYPLPGPTAHTLYWDFALIAGYGVALIIGNYVVTPHVARTRVALNAVRLGQAAAILAIVAACLENAFLLLVAEGAADSSGWRDFLLDAASTSAVLKFGALIPAVAAALTGTVLTIVRCIVNSPGRLAAWSALNIAYQPPHPAGGDANDFPNPHANGGEPCAGVRWRAGFDVPSDATADGAGQVGFCLSGGGIRASCVALGVLQEMHGTLVRARHLVSVSGGGYTAGAFTQALTDAHSRPDMVRDPAGVFAPGSVGEDYIRRHSSYLANTVPTLLVALGLMLRHLILSIAALFAPAVVAGVLFGWFYDNAPIADLRGLRTGKTYEFNVFRTDALIALGIVTGVALVLWLAGQAAVADPEMRRAKRLRTASQGTAWLAGVIAAVAVVIPLLAAIAASLYAQKWVVQLNIAGPVGALVLTYLATIASIVWRNRTTITKNVGSGGASVVPAAIPNSVVQRLLVALTVIVLAAAWLLLFAGLILTHGTTAALWSALGIAVLAGILGFIDETTLSLHPFYRARLAAAFAVRTVRRPDGLIVPEAYPRDERTSLSTYARINGFPDVVFAATANLGGDRTPPGRNGVSYTFNADWVGGPDVGWIGTEDLQRLATARLRRDLTVQGAVAISGAAFASSMGHGARWFQILLAVSGARLGAWLPNPAYVKAAHTHARAGDWRYPRLPATRRLGYLLKEIFDIHPATDPLLQITDGGHYENLGLVELLRRRCTLIYCVDASGDHPPMATTLSQAIALAQDELGVTITLDDAAFDCEPGTGTLAAPKAHLGGLNARLSKTPVIIGTITYPPEPGMPAGLGRLIVGKALLTGDMPYWLLSYAAKHPVFPHDSTGDQWFDADQFSAYTELGRQLGQRMGAVPVPGPPPVEAITAPPVVTPTVTPI